MGLLFLASCQTFAAGVCAKVNLTLTQDAVATRTAFRASLDLVNNDAGNLISNVFIQVIVLDVNGQSAGPLFGVQGPELNNLTTVDGAGVVAPVSTGSAVWTFVPSVNAASNGPTIYKVGGWLSYSQAGQSVTIPLDSTPITVQPDAALFIKYFHQRDVLSDDPFTPAIEPAQPYYLVAQVENRGAGTAHNLSLSSPQPQILDNEKGLLINFQVVGASVDGHAVPPLLTANFGDLAPGQRSTALWTLTSSLQGLFTEYKATMQYLNGLGGRQFSSFQDVGIHEMIHLVQAPGAFEDGKPDFLVNDIPDPPLDLPDTLYLSDGSTSAVQIVTSGTVIGTLSPASLAVTQIAVMPSGWSYLRVPDPANGQYQLKTVMRSDGVQIYFGTNVWTTDRTFIGMGKPPIRENILHLLDHDSTGSYTLTYAPVAPPDTNAPSSSVTPLPAQSGVQIPVTWSGADNLGGGGIASYDIYVSSNNATFAPWLQGTALNVSIYNGVPGSTYAFYSIATDAAGNREPAPPTPDAVTTVTLSNSPPTLTAITNRIIDEGTELNVSVTASDADLPNDELIFSLLSAPPGVTLAKSSQTTAQLRWPTGEGNGPSTNLVSVSVRDNGVHSFSDTQTFSVTVREVNTAPTLAAITNRTINEGQLLTITASASDSDLSANALTYSLGRKPSGATINASSGVFSWQPTDIQGGTNYPVDIIVSDSGVPSLSATQSFIVTVKNTRNDFAFSIGSTNVVPGESNSVPLLASSGTGLKELSFVLETDPARLGNLALQSVAAGIASSLQSNGMQSLVQLTAVNVASLDGDGSLARLNFVASSNEHSSVIPLRALNVQFRQADGSLLPNPSIGSGRVFIVGREPILDAALRTNGARVLTLYGHAGKHYVIQSRTNFLTGPWHFAKALNLPAAVWPVENLDGTASSLFLRAVEKPETRLKTHLQRNQLILSWPVSDSGCVLEQTASLSPAAAWTAVPGIVQVVGGELFVTNSTLSNRFFRLRCGDMMPVVNGGFEAEDWSGLGTPLLPNDAVGFRTYLGLYGRALTGWSVTIGGTVPAGVNNTSGYGPAPEGNQFIALGPYPTGGSGVEQTITGFETGRMYRVSFSISSEYYYSPARVRVSFENGSSTSSSDFNAPLATGYFWDHWNHYSLPFVATNTSVTVRFTDLGSEGGLNVGLDDVSITTEP
jgi:hypothetical protein